MVEEGLRFKYMTLSNKVMVGKLWWHWITKLTKLWIQIWKRKYVEQIPSRINSSELLYSVIRNLEQCLG